MLLELVKQNRSYRRFFEDERITETELKELVNLARLSASAANLQPLKFRLVVSKTECEKTYQCLGWAGYLSDWPGPKVGERPAAYVVIVRDIKGSRNVSWDAGIACQSMLLGAAEKGWGGCIFASIQKENLQKALSLPENMEIQLVVALGKPQEKVVLEEVGDDGDIRYWRDEQDTHHVPKRKLQDIIIK
jgi:nitroreductase